MVKHVVTTNMVPHLWAQQNPDQGWAKSGKGSISYGGRDLISYSTVIARFVEDVNGESVVLISRNRRGVTTGGQISRAIRATRHLTQFTNLSDVGNSWREPDHRANLDVMIAEYRDDIAKQKRAVNFDRGGPLSIVATARDYARRFGLQMPVINEDAEWAEVVAIQAAREAKRNTPAAIRAREKAAERRDAKRTEEQRVRAEVRRLSNARWARRTRTAGERGRGACVLFRAGSIHYGHCSDDQGGALLRLSDDHLSLQTSWGVNVPIVEAIKAFRVILRFKEGRVTPQDDAHRLLPRPPSLMTTRPADDQINTAFPVGLAVGGFRVDRINKDGSIKAGCHVIHWPEIERVAVELGFLDEPEEWAAYDVSSPRMLRDHAGAL